MQWKLTTDRYGLESNNYRIRPHPARNGRWMAIWQPFLPGRGVTENCREVLGGFNTTLEAKSACARHAEGKPPLGDSRACRICGEMKPLEAYSKHYGDRLKTACRVCLNRQRAGARKKANRKNSHVA